MPWREEKQEILQSARRILVKAGSAVLTNSEGLDRQAIANLVDQITDLHKRGIYTVLVTSGAAAAGRAVLKGRTEVRGIPDRQAAAAVGQSRLMHCYDEMFAARGITSAQILLTREDLRDRHRFLNARNAFGRLLSWGVIPIVNENDTVAVQELQFGDNDTLGSLLLNLVEADLFVNLTSAAGVKADNPDRNPDAGIMPCIEDVHSLNLTDLCGAKTTVGTGGMYSKLLAARRAAQLGVPTLILPGREPDVLRRALAGEELGTWVRSELRGISRRKFWLAYNQVASGSVHVDAGAAGALRKGGRSLLPAGIVGVDGDFDIGDMVRIIDPDGEPVGVGLSNYSAKEMRETMGRKLVDLSDREVDNQYPEAIHCDNMLIGAVV